MKIIIHFYFYVLFKKYVLKKILFRNLMEVENLMPICNSCNSSMGIKDMNEYKK